MQKGKKNCTFKKYQPWKCSCFNNQWRILHVFWQNNNVITENNSVFKKYHPQRRKVCFYKQSPILQEITYFENNELCYGFIDILCKMIVYSGLPKCFSQRKGGKESYLQLKEDFRAPFTVSVARLKNFLNSDCYHNCNTVIFNLEFYRFRGRDTLFKNSGCNLN